MGDCNEHSTNLVKNISTLENEEDRVTLVAGNDGQRVKIHRVILSAMCTYFQKLLDNNIVDGRKEEIILGNLDGDILEELVSFAYTSKLDVNDENVKELMEIALTFELNFLWEKCAKYIDETLSIGNCIDWFTFAGEFRSRELRRDALQMIVKNFIRISMRAIQSLDYIDFKQVLKSAENVHTKEIILERLTKWIEYDEDDRMEYALDLLKCIQSKGISNRVRSQPTIEPNFSGRITIIEESELRRGDLIGRGTFGKVTKGTWKPENGNCQYSVAIKTLENVNPAHEAYTPLTVGAYMPWLDHPNLLKIYGVCMASEMMLITPLMPLGSLRDYMIWEESFICSKAVIDWSTQIADAMAYLEYNSVVHGNLAARNVLLCTPYTVKISDCGSPYLSSGSNHKAIKTHIRWMALECIQNSIFSTKSDVWAFGVTIWELITLGGIPYECVEDKDMFHHIESELKLNQPEGCSLDVYNMLLTCWSDNPSDRPTFEKLAKLLKEYSKDPSNYLTVWRSPNTNATG